MVENGIKIMNAIETIILVYIYVYIHQYQTILRDVWLLEDMN